MSYFIFFCIYISIPEKKIHVYHTLDPVIVDFGIMGLTEIARSPLVVCHPSALYIYVSTAV